MGKNNFSTRYYLSAHYFLQNFGERGQMYGRLLPFHCLTIVSWNYEETGLFFFLIFEMTAGRRDRGAKYALHAICTSRNRWGSSWETKEMTVQNETEKKISEKIPTIFIGRRFKHIFEKEGRKKKSHHFEKLVRVRKVFRVGRGKILNRLEHSAQWNFLHSCEFWLELPTSCHKLNIQFRGSSILKPCRWLLCIGYQLICCFNGPSPHPFTATLATDHKRKSKNRNLQQIFSEK